MKNLKKIVTLAALALALTLSLASAKEANAATTMTKKQVAKAIAAAQEKAINKRKVVKVTVTFETKKSTWKYMDQIDDMVAQEYWGKLYMCAGVNSYDDAPFDIDLDGYEKSYDGKWTCDDDKTFYSRWTRDGDKYTVIFKFMGNHKDYKDAVTGKKYTEKIYDALMSATKGMTQAQKVCYVLEWFNGRMTYKNVVPKADSEDIWKGTAYGNCEAFSAVTKKCLLMAGVKHVANVEIPQRSHECIAVRLEDSRVYVIEPQSAGEGYLIDIDGDGYDDGEADQYDLMKMPEQAAIDYLAEANYDTIRCWGSLKYKLSWEDGRTENFKASKNKSYYSKYSW